MTVMSKKRSSVFQEIIRGDTAELAETVMTKKRKKRGRQFFSGKNRGVTFSVAAPGVTHPSDAIALFSHPDSNLKECRSASGQRCINRWVFGVAHKIDSDILFIPPTNFHGE